MIRNNIYNGVWKTGEYIPPMRVIAEQEGVSRGCVTSAISILVGEGVLESVPRHGMRVSDMTHVTSNTQSVKILAQKCVEIMNRRRTGVNNACRVEDLQVIRDYFSSIMDEEYAAARNNQGSVISAEEVLLYDKGLRCAGWSYDRYTLYRCNLTNDVSDLIRGNLLNFIFDPSDKSFDDRTMDYVEKRVHPNDAVRYLELMNSHYLIKKAGEDDYYTSIDYREKTDDTFRWIKLSLNVSREPQTSDVVLYLLYQDIDEEKKNELLLKERTDEDALTGALNRRAFTIQSEQLISESDENRQHAFLMLDVDGFKSINDMFGHPVGDTVLTDLSKALHTILRSGDLFGRIGGDEFMICLKDIPFDAVIEKKASQINELMRRDFDKGASISGSIGIAVYPRDGDTFEQLYAKVDMALYHAKESGKDRYEFYRTGMTRSENGVTVVDSIVVDDESPSVETSSPKKKILIVDDIEANRNNITALVKDEYTILQSKDGRRALLTLRRYGVSISAVILKLDMPGMNGFEVLQNMQREPILKSIPVIIISDSGNIEDEFKAIEMGAMDFVTKPIDQRLLKLRIRNSVNKQENDRLRVQNSYLQLQGEEEQRYRYIIESTSTIVIEHDWVNSVFTYDKMISRYLYGTFDHRPLWRILLSDMVAGSMDVKAMQTMIYELANSHTETQATMRVRLKTAKGDKHWFEMNAIKLVDEFSITNKLLITLNDINDKIMVEEKLRNLVEYDSLTEIYNRDAFLKKAEETIKQSKSGKWLLSIIDIEGFKVFNHLYGHDEGDRLLVYLSKQLSIAVKRYGGVCGRLHTDTFAALHPARRDCIDHLSAIRDKVVTNYSINRRITTCTGRCYVDDITVPINTIIDRAMIAHQMAKNTLSRDLYFTDDMQKRVLHDQEIISRVEHALENSHFSLYFQPIYEYATNRIITAEALVRWITPEGKIIMPDEFIPLFEQNGFIVRLDAYVWEKTCQYIRSWLDSGIDIVPISVNVSRMDIYNGRLIETISSLTKKYNIPPSLLRIEITESAYINNPEQIVTHVEELQKMGFIIEIDDFGSGYSSLNILSEVPVDILKLDMKFLLGEDRRDRKSKIMGHIISMAKSSNIDVIAEGVETYEQAEFLNSLGCSNMQGYYFSRPVEQNEFVKCLQSALY